MILQICIASIAVISWPLSIALYRKKDFILWLEMRNPFGKTKPTESPLPPMSLPLRYDNILKNISAKTDETGPTQIRIATPKPTTEDPAPQSEERSKP